MKYDITKVFTEVLFIVLIIGIVAIIWIGVFSLSVAAYSSYKEAVHICEVKQ